MLSPFDQSNYVDDDGQQTDLQDQTFKRWDTTDEELFNQTGYNPTASNLVHLPNQSNAFFASGFKMIDPVHGDLEHLYQ